MPAPLHFVTTTEQAWQTAASTAAASGDATPVSLGTRSETAETWEGFGGCFNELGWQALRELPPLPRAKILDALFGPDGLSLDIGRIPMGASDYASEWHSYTEKRDDFALDGFSIARDQSELLPFIHEAIGRRSDLQFFGSPWSPPTWMKFPAVYNYGKFRMEPRYLDTYANYFARFIETYRAEGVKIAQVHPQNEPVADQKFPSCVWSGEHLRDFIGGHLGPILARHAPDTQVWLGTMNTADYRAMFLPTLSDPACRQHLRGIGLQWAGKGIVHRLRQLHPELPTWQTENECGDGSNSWHYAHDIFDLVCHYVGAGSTAYAYWNMVLAPGGLSSWGWKQNALVTVDASTGRWCFNPEYHVMRHFSAFIRPGARRLPLTGEWAGSALAFARPEGGAVLVTHNPGSTPRRLHAVVAGHEADVVLAPHSFHTLVWTS